MNTLLKDIIFRRNGDVGLTLLLYVSVDKRVRTSLLIMSGALRKPVLSINFLFFGDQCYGHVLNNNLLTALPQEYPSAISLISEESESLLAK